MAILNRVSRLLTADLHAVLDRLEEPQAQLQQALREMHDAIQYSQQEQQDKASQIAALHAQQRQLAEQHGATQQELDLCLAAQQDKLARTVIRRRLQLERNQALVQQQLTQTQQGLEKLTERLEAQKTQLQELTHRTDLASQVQAAHSPTGLNPHGDNITEADIDLALLAEQQKRVQS